jgi:hypothetical protein
MSRASRLTQRLSMAISSLVPSTQRTKRLV